MLHSRNSLPIFAVAIASLAACCTPAAHAELATWAAPNSGFFDDASNWDPAAVPAWNDTLVFAQAGSYDVGLTGDHDAANLTLANNADVGLVVAGAGGPSRSLRVTGDLSIDEAQLRLQGNPAGPRLNTVLYGDINLFGGPNTLQVIDNVGLVNRATVIDVDGVIPVRGARAHWRMHDDLTVGGGARLSVADGATVVTDNNVIIGPSATNGSIEVAGVGDDQAPSLLEVDGRLLLGFFGAGQLFVRDGGHVDIAGLFQAGTGPASFGGVFVGSDNAEGRLSVLNTGPATLGAGGGADVSVQSGGRVNSESVTIANSGQALVELVGGELGAEWNIAGDLQMAQGAYGQLVVNEGAVLRSNRALMGLGSETGAPAVAVLTGDAAGPTTRWENHGDFYLAGNAAEARSAATLRIDGNAAANIGGSFTIWNQGELTLGEGGSLTADTIDHTNGGAFNLEGGKLSVNRFAGDLKNLAGSLSPGSDSGAAATLITGDYDQRVDAKLAIGVGGTSPGGTYDLVSVLGAFAVDGLLELSLLDGFTPDASDLFTVLAADSLSGFFENINSGQRLDTTDGRGSFVVHYGIGSAFDETRVILSDFQSSGLLPGDYNNDGVVDAADFSVWRDALGAPAGTLANDIDGGVIGAEQYETWAANFGLVSSTPFTAFTTTAVPEPSAIMLLVASVAVVSLRGARNA